jgi:hypothetical protein
MRRRHPAGQAPRLIRHSDDPPEEPAPEPKQVTPQGGGSMRASDIDPLSGVPKPTESEHVRWRHKKPLAGPPSERERQRLAQERARKGGDGKRPW